MGSIISLHSLDQLLNTILIDSKSRLRTVYRTYLDNSKRNHERENEENSTDLADLAQAHAEHS